MSAITHIGSFLTGAFATVAGVGLGIAAAASTAQPALLPLCAAFGIAGGYYLRTKERRAISSYLGGVVLGGAMAAIPVLGMRVEVNETSATTPEVTAPLAAPAVSL